MSNKWYERLLLFNRQWVGAWDGELVEEHQELSEGLKEGPAWEQTDAFIGVHRPVGDHLLLHRGEQAQLDLLLLAQQIHWIRLVELDSWSVHLRRHRWDDSFSFSWGLEVFIYFFLNQRHPGYCISPFHLKRRLRQMWRRRAEGHECSVPNTRYWHPWANRTEAQTLTEEKNRSLLRGNERSDLENWRKTWMIRHVIAQCSIKLNTVWMFMLYFWNLTLHQTSKDTVL